MMTDPLPIRQKETKRTMLVIWASGATLVALVSTGLAIVFFLQARLPVTSQNPSVSASPFLDLRESGIPGSYKWISHSGSESFITLNPDHSFSKDGGTNPSHRWEITRDALVIFWLRNQNRLNRIERPGVYVEIKDGVESARLERVEGQE